MPRARNKEDLLKFSSDNYNKLKEIIAGMSENQLNTEFDFSDMEKSGAHWSRDKSLRDILIHLYEWHQLLLSFVKNNAKCTDAKNAIQFLPPEYSWKTYGAMNIMFWKRNQSTPLDVAKKQLDKSHAQVMKLAESYSNEELFTKKYFKWTGTTDLGSYFVSASASHYEWAIKKLRLHCKKVK